jgi:hypothetical protein
MSNIKLYVKQLNGNTLLGYLVREQESKLEIKLKIDDCVYNKLLDALQKTNYLSLEVHNGFVVSLLGEIEKPPTQTIEEFIMEVLQHGKLKKKELYEKVISVFPVSEKTIQRTLHDLERSNTSFHIDFNNVWLGDS